MSNVDDYIANGGKVTKCPSIERKSKLKRKTSQAKIDEPLCIGCPNNKKKRTCKGLCPPMAWINGNAPTKEVLLSDMQIKQLEYKDYNQDLAELIEDRQSRITNAIGVK
jgi:hypothetical protein